MINLIRYSLRILFKYRLYTGFSLMGLSVAISSLWFIASYVGDFYHYDAFHTNSDRIYRITMEVAAGGNTDHYATTGRPPGDLLHKNYTGIKAYAKMSFYDPVVKVNDEVLKEIGFFSVNPEVLDIFSFKFLTGNKTTCFSLPNSILLSRRLAEKYFDDVYVVGEQITVDEKQFIVSGVFEDWPKNSHLNVQALSYSEEFSANYEAQDWFDLEQYNYVLLDPSKTEMDLKSILDQFTALHIEPILSGSGIDVTLHAQPLDGLFFADGLINDTPKGNLIYARALSLAGLLVFVIAGLNYINLLLSRSTQRDREVRLKKTLGATPKQLLIQNGIESFIMTLLVFIVSLILVLCFNTNYTDYTGYQALSLTGNSWLPLGLILTIFVFGLLGTSYSGGYLTFSNRLIQSKGKAVGLFKKAILGFQFVVAAVILAVVLTMEKQIDFMKNKDLGFSKEHVVIIALPDQEEFKDQRDQFREQVKTYSTVKNASLIASGALPGEDNGKEVFEVMVDGSREERVYAIYGIDENYCDLLNIQFATGRNFRANSINDLNNAVIINEALAKSLNWSNPLGKIIWCYGVKREVIGVVKNFHNKSLHNLIEPIVFLYNSNYSANLLIKTSVSDLSSIQSAWNEFFPDTPLLLSYFDLFIDKMYSAEDQLIRLLGFFTIVSLMLGYMGLFAVFSLQILQARKEMSIRRILGAGAINLLKSTTKSYMLIVLLAIGLAIPVAWLLLRSWLDGFSYRIQLDPVIFILSACLILLGSLCAMAYHVHKILNVNPVDSLRDK